MMPGIPTALEAPISPENYSDISDSLPSFVREISEHPDKGKAAPLLDDLVPYCVDLGVSQERRFTLNRGDVHIDENADPVFILNRSAFITYIEELPEDVRNNSSIQFLDIEDLRSSANVPTDSEDAAADIIINNFSRKLTNNAHELNAVLSEDPSNTTNPRKVTVGRYGGDEYVILFENFNDSDAKKSALEYITNPENGVTSIEGYFMKKGQLEKHKVHLKENMPEISVPKDEPKHGCFLENMRRGLLLSDEEIEDILKIPESNLPERSLPQIPENTTVQESTERWEELLRSHPEFTDMFSNIDTLYKNPDENFQKKLGLEKFLYNIAYDRLIGECVSNTATFPKHFLEKQYKNINIVDLKGLKEINDNLSIASGDGAILATWYKIASVLFSEENNPQAEEDLSNLGIFKRGGLFIICDNAEPKEDPSNISQLLTKLTIYINGTKSTFGLASASWSNSSGKVFTTEKEVTEMMGELITKSEKEYYKNQILENIKHPEYFDNTQVPSKEEIKQNHIDISHPEIFIRMFLYGKRIEERTSKAISAINIILEDLKDPNKAENILENKGLTSEEMVKALEYIRQKIKTPKS